jgi:predicted nucleic acid-binding protein
MALFTSNVVVHEAITLIRLRLGYEQAVQFGKQLLAETTVPIVRVTSDDERQAWNIFQRYRDKRLSFVDCSSFAVMQRLGAKAAFSFDDDFRQIGKFVVHPLSLEG